MVQKIALRLQLPPPQKIIKIEEIASREEIEKAIRSRQIEGKHVIPVPAIEVKRSYPRIFYKSIREFLSKRKVRIRSNPFRKVNSNARIQQEGPHRNL